MAIPGRAAPRESLCAARPPQPGTGQLPAPGHRHATGDRSQPDQPARHPARHTAAAGHNPGCGPRPRCRIGLSGRHSGAETHEICPAPIRRYERPSDCRLRCTMGYRVGGSLSSYLRLAGLIGARPRQREAPHRHSVYPAGGGEQSEACGSVPTFRALVVTYGSCETRRRNTPICAKTQTLLNAVPCVTLHVSPRCDARRQAGFTAVPCALDRLGARRAAPRMPATRTPLEVRCAGTGGA